MLLQCYGEVGYPKNEIIANPSKQERPIQKDRPFFNSYVIIDSNFPQPLCLVLFI